MRGLPLLGEFMLQLPGVSEASNVWRAEASNSGQVILNCGCGLYRAFACRKDRTWI